MLAKIIKRKNFVILLIATALLVAGFSVYFLLISRFTVTPEAQKTFVHQVDKFFSQGKFTEAEALISEQLDKNLSPDQLNEATFLMAINFSNQDNLGAAREWYLKVETTDTAKAYAVAESLASISLRLEDKDGALKYYKQVVEIAKSDQDPLNDEYIPFYESIIKRLENNQPIVNPALPRGVEP